MDTIQESSRTGVNQLIRVGGVAGLVGVATHFLVNGILKTFPPPSADLPQLQQYLAEQASTWAIVHGLRYVAIAGMVLMVAALYARTVRASRKSDGGWGFVGLLGATMWLANLLITNGIEIFAFTDLEKLSNRVELFYLTFHLTRVLFTAEIIAWAVVIFGFSMSGWRTAMLPRWLVLVGMPIALAGLVANIFISSIMRGSSVAVILDIGALGGLLWFISVSVYLAMRGDRLPVDET